MESWQSVTPEEVTTMSELKDIKEALKDGKENLAALLRYLVSCPRCLLRRHLIIMMMILQFCVASKLSATRDHRISNNHVF